MVVKTLLKLQQEHSPCPPRILCACAAGHPLAERKHSEASCFALRRNGSRCSIPCRPRITLRSKASLASNNSRGVKSCLFFISRVSLSGTQKLDIQMNHSLMNAILKFGNNFMSRKKVSWGTTPTDYLLQTRSRKPISRRL